MEKRILDQYADLLQEQKDCKRRIQSSRDKILRLEQQQVRDTVRGGSGGRQRYIVEGCPDNMIEEERNLLEGRIAREERLEVMIRNAMNEVETFIFTLQDSRMRRILNYKYVDRLTWREVAKRMGSSCTADSCRKELERFFEKM